MEERSCRQRAGSSFAAPKLLVFGGHIPLTPQWGGGSRQAQPCNLLSPVTQFPYLKRSGWCTEPGVDGWALPLLPPPALPPHSPLGPARGSLSLMTADTRSGSWQLVSEGQCGRWGEAWPWRKIWQWGSLYGAAAPTDGSVRVQEAALQGNRRAGKSRTWHLPDIRGAGLFLKAPPA